jgi:hypothetical protein
MSQTETAAVLKRLQEYLARFLIVDDDQMTAITLWIALTYVWEAGDTVPYLIVTSAEKRSGKTRVIECVQSVCNQPVVVTGLTEAVLFRIMERKPTLLIDETDTIFKQGKELSERQEALRAILNAGYRRGTVVYRCAPNGELIPFPVFGPKLLAGIGHLPDTIEDRGLCIRLKRKLDTEEVERFRYRVSETEGDPIRKQLTQWAAGKVTIFAGLYPELPDELDDRAQDAYEMLVVIADHAGERWGKRARAALVALRSNDVAARDSRGVRLLSDLALVVERLPTDGMIPTLELLDWLYREGENEWEEWWGETTGKKAARRLAMTLSEYDIAPHKFRDGPNLARGYPISDLRMAVARYISEGTTFSQNTTRNATDPVESYGLFRVEGANGPDETLKVEDSPLDGTESTRKDMEHATDPVESYGLLRVEPVPDGRSTVDLGTASLDELRKLFP